MAKSLPFTDKSMKNGTLSVNLNEILAELGEQRHFLKKIVFHIKNQRDALQMQSKIDSLCSAFHLIQEENGPFSPAFFVDSSIESFMR